MKGKPVMETHGGHTRYLSELNLKHLEQNKGCYDIGICWGVWKLPWALGEEFQHTRSKQEEITIFAPVFHVQPADAPTTDNIKSCCKSTTSSRVQQAPSTLSHSEEACTEVCISDWDKLWLWAVFKADCCSRLSEPNRENQLWVESK